LWLPRLSMMTISPDLGVGMGQRNLFGRGANEWKGLSYCRP
jgi:hypothetical protein